MTSERRRIGTAFVFVTLLLVVGLGLRPLPTERILSLYVLALAAIVLASLTRAAQPRPEHQPPSELEHALRRRDEHPLRPPELVRTERELTLGMASSGHAYRRLLPLLREAAAARLAAHHGVELERRPETARELLGEETWALLRPDRPEPEDRNATGLSFAQVEAAVERLERL